MGALEDIDNLSPKAKELLHKMTAPVSPNTNKKFYKRVSGKPYATNDNGISNIYYEDCTYEVEALLSAAKIKTAKEVAGTIKIRKLTGDEITDLVENYIEELGKAYPVCNDCKENNDINCPHLEQS